jgi:SNF2 family DNA or RNA helicase
MQTGGVLADDMGLGKTLQAIALLLWVKDQESGAPDEVEESPVVEKKTKTIKTTKKKAAAKEASVDEPAPKAKAKKTATKSKKTAKSSEPAEEEAPPAKSKGEEPETGDIAVKAPKEPRKGPLALVIAPTSVVPNWVREIGKFGPSLKAIAWTGGDREKYKHELERVDVVVTSYALLRRDEELLRGLECGYVILDEAQHIKNPLSATARAAKSLNGEHRLALTGTPIENRLSEIWSIFDFLSPGILGPLSQFEERYSRPIDRGDPDAAKRLRNAIHPFVLRRTKSEVAKDLPEKIVSELLCDMPPNQAAVYKTVLKAVRDEVLGEVERVGVAKSQLQILAGLTRLRQAACDPRLLKVPGDLKDDDSGKLEALRELLAEASQSGHRTLVFSQFVTMLTLIRRAIEQDGLKYEYIDGSTIDRQERVDRFNRDENIPVFLISLKAGGTGLNLTGADTVVHFDPWWNPAVEDQATDRAHRIGQTKVVTAYRLVARGTIEEKILSLSAKKRELVANVLGKEEEGGLRGFTKAEVENLLADD